MHDIFSRLPVQSLSQCRFVSKDWYNLIKDPDFIKLHHSRINKYSSACLIAHCRKSNTIDERVQFFNLVDNHSENNPNNSFIPTSSKALNIQFDLPQQTKLQRLKVIGSANGLMCLRVPRYNEHVFYICNPVTREILQLPKPPGVRSYSENKYNLHYVFPHSPGFGFHAATNTYKVVRTCFFCVKGSTEELCDQIGIEMYNVGSGVWRWIDLGISSTMSEEWPLEREASLVFLNEALHWKIEDYNVTSSGRKHCIGVIDIGDETFRTFEKPIRDEKGIIPTRTLSSLRQCLCLIDQFKHHIVVWIMNQYGVSQSWTKEHVIQKEMLGSLPTTSYMHFYTLDTMKNIVLIHGGDYQGYYDFEKQEFNQILIDGIHSVRNKLQIVAHVGSLISPRSITCTSDASQVASSKPIRPMEFRPKKNVKNPSRLFIDICIVPPRTNASLAHNI